MAQQQAITKIEASADRIAAYQEARERRQRAAEAAILAYYHDPVSFARECFYWGPGEGLKPYQEQILRDIVAEGKVCVRSLHGVGKALEVSTPIPVPDGWKTMGQLEVGDQVIAEDGKPCNVVSVSPRWHGDTWRVTFSDGSSLVTHGNHEWKAVDIDKRPMKVGDWRTRWDATDLVTTRHMANTLRNRNGQLRWRVPTARPLNLPDADLPIDPYVLGVWLGDGETAGARLTLADQGIVDEVRKAGEPCRQMSPIGWSLSDGVLNRAKTGSFRQRLRDIGVLGHKHIPVAYLRASESQRRALVQGLMDTDGFRTHMGADGIDLSNKQLAADVCELFRSLGLVVRAKEEDSTLDGRVVGRRWRILARFDECPFRLERKRDGWPPRANQGSRHTQRTITSVEQVADAETVCITVDSPSHLFLAGEDMVPTHNTTTNAIAILWFAVTREGSGVDWKCITTAGAWRQLKVFLWPEVHKWARRIRWERLGRDPFKPTELLQMELKGTFGAATAVASNDPALIEGAHADSILYIYDEAKAIIDALFDASEGAFSGEGEAYALAASTPGEPVGRFYAIQSKQTGYEDWHAIHIGLQEALDCGQVSQEWADRRALQWGKESGLYANRVLGEFHSSDEDAVIPLSWIEAAVERWRERRESRAPLPPIDVVGVDVARSGDDQTVMALKRHHHIEELRYTFHETIDVTAGRAGGILLANPGAKAVVDTDGLGAGVTDVLRASGHKVDAFHAGEKTDKRDKSGELGFANVKAAAWWTMRELLDPMVGSDVELPDDPILLGDLSAPHWAVTDKSQIKVEGKDDVKKRLGRSTDAADAVVQAFWAPPVRRKRRMTYAGVEPRTPAAA